MPLRPLKSAKITSRHHRRASSWVVLSFGGTLVSLSGGWQHLDLSPFLSHTWAHGWSVYAAANRRSHRAALWRPPTAALLQPPLDLVN